MTTWFDSNEFSGDNHREVWAKRAVDKKLKFPFVFKYLRSDGVRLLPLPVD